MPEGLVVLRIRDPCAAHRNDLSLSSPNSGKFCLFETAHEPIARVSVIVQVPLRQKSWHDSAGFAFVIMLMVGDPIIARSGGIRRISKFRSPHVTMTVLAFSTEGLNPTLGSIALTGKADGIIVSNSSSLSTSDQLHVTDKLTSCHRLSDLGTPKR